MKLKDRPRFLIIDDDASLRELMTRALLSRFPESLVYTLSSSRWVMDFAGLWRPHVIIMDWVLGSGKTGVRLCRDLKSRPSTRPSAVLIVSGQHTQERDGLKGIAGGGDAFLPKPFSIKRFLSYAGALLQKNALLRGPGENVILAGRWLLDYEQRRLISESSGSRRLPKTLFELLWVLAKRYPRSASVEHLVRYVWKNHVRDSQVAVTVLRLKKHLGPLQGTIETVAGGYRLVFP